ncbi:hypothetical protein FQN54_004726 [Arachnomyces sp. PD_36]|nr:hypothetical protein FQN54_004726 [Arachnomyces sp. PD_36]
MAARQISARPRPPSTDVLPTTKWANRVLRPLNSIVLRLEKHWRSTAPPDTRGNNSRDTQHNNNRNTSASPRKRASLPNTSTTGRGRFGDTGAELSGSESSRDDPDDPSWVPGQQDARRKVRHKYSRGNPRGRGTTAGAGRVVSIFKSPEVRRRSLPGEITMATPLIIGRGKDVFGNGGGGGDSRASGTDQDSSGEVRGGNRFAARSKWAQSDATTSRVNGFQDYDDLGYLAIIDGICPVFEAFLRATSDRQPAKMLGARSLMSMALRKVSDYIGEEQKLYDESDDKDEEVDMADVIFTELEEFYGLPGGGWKPLRELVRAHGIRLICESVRKKWVSPNTAQRLITSSLHLSCHDTAKTLFSTLLSIAPSIDKPKGLHSCLFSDASIGERGILSPYLDLVSAEAPGHLSFFFREVRLLITRGAVPVEWMATESMKPFMNRAVQSISCGDEDSSTATEFLQAMVLVAAGIDTSIYRSTIASLRKTKKTRLRYRARARSVSTPLWNDRSMPSHLKAALNNTISSLITLLSGIHISRFGVGSESSNSISPARDIITRLSTAVQQDIELRCSESKSEFTALQSTRCSYILLGEYLCLGGSFGKASDTATTNSGSSLLANFDAFIQTMSHRKDLLGELSDLVEQVVTCCGRALGTDGFDQLKGFSRALTSTNTGCYLPLKLLLGKVAVESAMTFAESTQHPDHHEWATEIQTRAAEYNATQDASDDAECPTPSLYMSRTGFRWEDSIGEWVAKTPAGSISKNLYVNADSRTTIPDSEDPYTSPIQSFSDRKAAFPIQVDSSSVVSSSPPQPSRKRDLIESSPFKFQTVSRKKSKTTRECVVEVTTPPKKTSLPRPRGLRQRNTWKPYTDDIDDNEAYPLPLSPSRSPERQSTASPRRSTRNTRSTTRERVLQEQKQNTHLSRVKTRSQKRKSVTFEVVVFTKKRKDGSDADGTTDNDDDDGHDHDDDDISDGDWPGSPANARSRLRRSNRQFQRSPSEESLPPRSKRPKRKSLPRKSSGGGGEVTDRNRMIPSIPVIEIADSEGSDDELSFL